MIHRLDRWGRPVDEGAGDLPGRALRRQGFRVRFRRVRQGIGIGLDSQNLPVLG